MNPRYDLNPLIWPCPNIQDSEAIAKDEVQKVLKMTEDRRTQWERAWDERRAQLEQNLQVCQFYFDLKQVGWWFDPST